MKKKLPTAWPFGVKISTTSTEPAGAVPATGTVSSVKDWSGTVAAAVPISDRLAHVSAPAGLILV